MFKRLHSQPPRRRLLRAASPDILEQRIVLSPGLNGGPAPNAQGQNAAGATNPADRVVFRATFGDVTMVTAEDFGPAPQSPAVDGLTVFDPASTGTLPGRTTNLTGSTDADGPESPTLLSFERHEGGSSRSGSDVKSLVFRAKFDVPLTDLEGAFSSPAGGDDVDLSHLLPEPDANDSLWVETFDGPVEIRLPQQDLFTGGVRVGGN